ncbi:hypothetical protein BGZ65_004228, partial [Modicella reniformis]
TRSPTPTTLPWEAPRRHSVAPSVLRTSPAPVQPRRPRPRPINRTRILKLMPRVSDTASRVPPRRLSVVPPTTNRWKPVDTATLPSVMFSGTS